jgi:glycerol kinase
VGVYQNTDELTDLWRSERRFLPTLDRPRAQELMERWSTPFGKLCCKA